jgi:hypothetical protein
MPALTPISAAIQTLGSPSTQIGRVAALAMAMVSNLDITQTSAASLSSPPAGLKSLGIATPIAVFGKDDRNPLSKGDSRLAAQIGTLSSRKTGAVCTAFCVAPDAIATASHCLFGTAGTSKPDLTQLQFKVGQGGEIAKSALNGSNAQAMRLNIISGTDRLAITPPIAAADDWAIARLEAPVCRAGGLALSQNTRAEVEQIAEAGGVFEVAVHRDISYLGLMLARPCALPRQFPAADQNTIARDFLNPGAVVFHTCDTGGGSSGSPLLIQGPNGPEVIAINVGTYVHSRMVMRASGETQTETSEAIANTAVAAEQFAGAIKNFLAKTASVPRRSADIGN